MNRRALLIGAGLGLGIQAFPVFADAQNAGAWGDTLYCQFADEATARSALAAALGIIIDPAQPIPSLGRLVVIVPPIVEWVTTPTVVAGVVTDPGEQRPGFWVMMKIRTDRDGYADTLASLAPYVQVLEHPSNVFA